ncbi:uncharacterized protein LOC114928130 [Nylanderia fulva]|uniref:uncharacterized protein LOC114928130 n=1 Tax=Nylanderia fulva TaxID=613905 RepID=UPI0010FB11D3|nr:uncharacterized protein LOC114928130 [Nylanderia fulva]
MHFRSTFSVGQSTRDGASNTILARCQIFSMANLMGLFSLWSRLGTRGRSVVKIFLPGLVAGESAVIVHCAGNIAIHASCWECCVKCRTIVIIRFRECRECNEGPREEEKAQGGIGRQWGNCEINMLCITIPLLHPF